MVKPRIAPRAARRSHDKARRGSILPYSTPIRDFHHRLLRPFPIFLTAEEPAKRTGLRVSSHSCAAHPPIPIASPQYQNTLFVSQYIYTRTI